MMSLHLPAMPSDSITAAIEQAQALALKKNRKEACAVLNRAYKSTAPQVRGRSKLIESLNQVSKVFFTDKGQKLFESGQVLLFENPDMALTQLREAKNLEDENVLILANLARAQMIKRDCDAALVNLEMARGLNPHAPELAVLELRGLLCAKKYDLFREKVKSLNLSEKWDQSFVQYLMAQEQIRQNSSGKAFDALTKIVDEFPQFPEAYYHLASAARVLERETTPWLQKYSMICKSLTLRERKRFSYEPDLCTRVKEVDDELAANKSDI